MAIFAEGAVSMSGAVLICRRVLINHPLAVTVGAIAVFAIVFVGGNIAFWFCGGAIMPVIVVVVAPFRRPAMNMTGRWRLDIAADTTNTVFVIIVLAVTVFVVHVI